MKSEESLVPQTTRFSVDEAQALVALEVFKVTMGWPAFNSAHEGFAILKEEVDELWDHVKVNQKKRDLNAMTKEAVQVAAMAIRFIVDICNERDGRK